MKPEDQRIAIADACGTLKGGWWCPACKVVVEPINVTHDERHDERSGSGCGNHVVDYPSPDYLYDLNAMHEAVQILDTKGRWKFAFELTRTVLGTRYSDFPPSDSDHLIRLLCDTTAAQRAEAFLRTIGKWHDPLAAPSSPTT